MSSPASGSNQSDSSIAPRYKPSEFQKFILVWTKKYKSKAEIPPLVSYVFYLFFNSKNQTDGR